LFYARVIVASLALALAVTTLQARFEHFKEIGGVIGTSVPALFLIRLPQPTLSS
jgi:high-affinity nickel-transport protein